MSKVISLLKNIVSMKSVTPDDGNILQYIANCLPEFKAHIFERNGVKNLFLQRKFGDGIHLCFAGHVDVVPAGNGWNSDPFIAKYENEYIIGRGTQDMKSGVASMVIALQETKNFNGTLSLLLTSDEEGDAKDGTIFVLEELAKIGNLPDFCLITEPTSEEKMGDVIKIGRRGSITGILNILGKQGHSAYPHRAINPVHLFANKLQYLAGHLFDSGDQYFNASQLVITDIRGGMEVSNVTPNNLKIMFNIRNSTATTLENIETYVKNICSDLNYSLKISVGSKPFLTNRDSLIVDLLYQSVKEVCQIEPNLTTGGGTSDARFMAQFGIQVAEFGVLNTLIHAVDEKVSIDEVEKLYKVCLELIFKFDLHGKGLK